MLVSGASWDERLSNSLRSRLAATASGVITATMGKAHMTIEGQKPSEPRVSDDPIIAIQKSQKPVHKSRFNFGVRVPSSLLMAHPSDSDS